MKFVRTRGVFSLLEFIERGLHVLAIKLVSCLRLDIVRDLEGVSQKYKYLSGLNGAS